MFSTKDRRPLITPQLRERLWPYLGGITRENGINAVSIGGVEDHVHLLLSVPTTMPIAKAMQLIKGGSSKWVHDTFPDPRLFAWQSRAIDNVAPASCGQVVAQVSKTGLETCATKQVWSVQRECFAGGQDSSLHRKPSGASPQDEFPGGIHRAVEKAGIEYDESYLWE